MLIKTSIICCITACGLLGHLDQDPDDITLPHLIPYFADGKWGYADSTGTLIVLPQYDTAMLFNNGVAVVGNFRKNDVQSYEKHAARVRKINFGIIDSSGKEILALQTPVEPDIKQLPIIAGKMAGEKRVFAALKQNGEEVLPYEFSNIVRATDELSIAFDVQGLPAVAINQDSLLDLAGKPWFNDSLDFDKFRSKTHAKVQTNTGIGMCDAWANLLVDSVYRDVEFWSPTLFEVVQHREGRDRHGCLDDKGRIIVPVEYDEVFPLSDNIVLAFHGNNFEPISVTVYLTTGGRLNNSTFHFAQWMAENVIRTEQRRGWQSVHKSGAVFQLSKYQNPYWSDFAIVHSTSDFYGKNFPNAPSPLDGFLRYNYKTYASASSPDTNAYNSHRHAIGLGSMNFLGEVVDSCLRTSRNPRSPKKANTQEIDHTAGKATKYEINTMVVTSLRRRFEEVKQISSQYYAARTGEFWMIVDSFGTRCTGNYEKIGEFHMGIAGVKRGNWTFINSKLEEIVPPRYSKISMLDSGYACGFLPPKTQLWDTNGRLLRTFIDTTLDYREHAGRILGRCNSQIGFVDVSGNVRIEFKYDNYKTPRFGSAGSIGDPYRFTDEGVAQVYLNGNSTFIDTNGNTVCEALPGRRIDYYNRRHIVSFPGGGSEANGSSFNVCNLQLHQLTKEQFYEIGIFSNGIAPARPDSSSPYGYIDSNFQWICHPQFSYAGSFNKAGKAIVKSDSLFGLLDKTGRFLIEPRFKYLSHLYFSNVPLLIASMGTELFVVNLAGKNVKELVSVPEYLQYENGCWTFWSKEQKGLIKRDGTVLSEDNWSWIKGCANGVFLVKSIDGFVRYIDIHGRKYWKE